MALTERERATVNELNERHRCARCALYYVVRDNLGMWLCSFHPGRLDPRNGGRYTCCGAWPEQVAGCTRCDHVTVRTFLEHPHEPPLAMSVERAPVIMGQAALSHAPGVQLDARTGRYLVTRHA